MRRALLLFFLALPLLGQEKSLHWTSIDVQARLDRDGNLRVVERQKIVFNGDWNGGERDFGLRPGQRLDVHSIVRVQDGVEIPVLRGDLNENDRYDFASSGVVRWRSRLPSEPPFVNRELMYVLDVTYANALQANDGAFRLAHDFGLPSRAGIVQRFALGLDFDPVWNTLPVIETRTDLQPGDSVTIVRDLKYGAEGWPAGILRPLPVWVPLLAVALLFGGATLLIRSFRNEERETGRLAPIVPQFDPELLKLKAEVAGAAWDTNIGAPEVAATLARMTQEKKITTRIDDDVLHLTLNVDRDSLLGYEHLLVEKLFFDGRKTTDTDAIKEHYKSTGFNPAQLIRHEIEEELAQIPGWTGKVPRFRWWVHALELPAAAFVLLVCGFFGGEAGFPLALGSLFFGTFIGIAAAITAWFKSRAVTDLTGAFVGPAILLGLPMVAFLAFAIAATTQPGIAAPVLFGLVVWLLAWLHLVLNLLKIRHPRTIIAYRKRIAGARKYFTEQLQLPQPALHDEWLPYLLAFGLGTNVDRWFRSFGGHVNTASSSWSSSGSSSSSSSSSAASSWTGGGGAFGGAGATGSFAVAAGAMAAGVASPSSSSGGGGGGGGSSSGGGGGGGW